MAQVLTSEGLAEFHSTGKVPEFVKPEEPKPDVKADEVKSESSPASTDAKDDVDDTEDENGLTPRQKRELTSKMLKAIGAKHKAAMLARKEADEATSLAENQFNERKLIDRKLEEVQRKLDEIESKSIPQTADEKEPQRKDFASDAEYWDAKIDWKADQKVKANEARRLEQEQAALAQKLDAARIERNKAFAATVDDYEETIESLGESGLNVPGHISQYLMESETSAQLMYYFAKHQDEYQSIAALSPIRAIAAIGKLEARLEAKGPDMKSESNPQTPISRAPAPIQPIQESATPVQKDPAKMTFDELRVYNREQRIKKSRH